MRARVRQSGSERAATRPAHLQQQPDGGLVSLGRRLVQSRLPVDDQVDVGSAPGRQQEVGYAMLATSNGDRKGRGLGGAEGIRIGAGIQENLNDGRCRQHVQQQIISETDHHD